MATEKPIYAVFEYVQSQGGTRLTRKEYPMGSLAGLDEHLKEEVVFETEGEIALLFDYNSKCPHESVLLKHGDPDVVRDTWKAYKPLGEALKKAGESQLVFLKGQFQVSQLNKIINTTGYVGTWYSTMISVDGRKNLRDEKKHQHLMGLS